VAAKLELPEDRWSLAFQSRLGRAEWLEPQTIKYIEEVYKRGHKNLAVICPSFVVDCLETLEEVNVEMKERWLELGGETFKLIPCLNADDGWVEAAHKLITNDNLQQILSEA
jgi:ferrochelatase